MHRVGLGAFFSSVLVCLLALAAGSPARADLADDAERVVKLLSAQGARVERRTPVFLEQGRIRAVGIEPGEKGCAAILFLATRSMEFLVDTVEGLAEPHRFEEPEPPRERAPDSGATPRESDRQIRSVAGAALVTR